MSADWIAPAAGIVGTVVGASISLLGGRLAARDRVHERRAALVREISDAAESFAASLIDTRDPETGDVPFDTVHEMAHLATLIGSLRAVGAPEGLRTKCSNLLQDIVQETDPVTVITAVGGFSTELGYWLRGWRPGAWRRWRGIRPYGEELTEA